MSSYIVCVNSNLEMFIFLVNKFCGELWLPCAACGRVTVGAVNTLLTLTSKELESLNLNKIIRLRLNSSISLEFDLSARLLNYERVPSVNINILQL